MVWDFVIVISVTFRFKIVYSGNRILTIRQILLLYYKQCKLIISVTCFKLSLSLHGFVWSTALISRLLLQSDSRQKL